MFSEMMQRKRKFPQLYCYVCLLTASNTQNLISSEYFLKISKLSKNTHRGHKLFFFLRFGKKMEF